MDAFCITICASPQGITVNTAPMTDEMEMQNGEPVESIDAALEKARMLYESQAGAPAEQQAESDFTSGFA